MSQQNLDRKVGSEIGSSISRNWIAEIHRPASLPSRRSACWPTCRRPALAEWRPGLAGCMAGCRVAMPARPGLLCRPAWPLDSWPCNLTLTSMALVATSPRSSSRLAAGRPLLPYSHEVFGTRTGSRNGKNVEKHWIHRIWGPPDT